MTKSDRNKIIMNQLTDLNLKNILLYKTYFSLAKFKIPYNTEKL